MDYVVAIYYAAWFLVVLFPSELSDLIGLSLSDNASLYSYTLYLFPSLFSPANSRDVLASEIVL